MMVFPVALRLILPQDQRKPLQKSAEGRLSPDWTECCAVTWSRIERHLHAIDFDSYSVEIYN